MIVAYERGYRIDDNGRIINPENHEIDGYIAKSGYKMFNIREGWFVWKVPVHRLMGYQKYGARLFEKGIQVRHLDSDKLNNSSDNIAIGTAHDNRMDMPPEQRMEIAKKATAKRRVYSDEIIAQVRKDRMAGMSYGKLRIKYGIPKATLSYIFNEANY